MVCCGSGLSVAEPVEHRRTSIHLQRTKPTRDAATRWTRFHPRHIGLERLVCSVVVREQRKKGTLDKYMAYPAISTGVDIEFVFRLVLST